MKIAIQGHPTRGKEVIQILKSLGGKNTKKLAGTYKTFYYIDNKNEIGDDHKYNFPPTYKFYTLEEFEKEFPFKKGDLCTYSSDILGKDIVVKILGMTIENDCIMYEVGHKDITNKYSYIYRKRDTLKPYKEMNTRNVTLTLDKAKEWYKKGGELREIALQAFTEQELNPLPKSWEEFSCKYKICSTRYAMPSKYAALYQLEQLRDCYRGLFVTVIGMPIWNINIYDGKPHIFQAMWGKNQSFLSFQSREVAEEYLKNFKPLIEQAGDLI